MADSSKCGSAKPAATRPQLSSKPSEAPAERTAKEGISSTCLGLALPGTVLPYQPQQATVQRAATRRRRQRAQLPSSTSSGEAQSCSSSSSSGGHPQSQQARRKPISSQYDAALSSDLRRHGMDLKSGPKPRKPPRQRVAQPPSSSLPTAAGSTSPAPDQVRCPLPSLTRSVKGGHD
jgi:hypothetical protein